MFHAVDKASIGNESEGHKGKEQTEGKQGTEDTVPSNSSSNYLRDASTILRVFLSI